MLALTLWLAGPASAGDGVDPGTISSPGGFTEEVVLGWSTVGFRAAVTESPAIGPDLVAAGPDGLVAMVDPVNHRVLVLDDLAFTAAYDVPRVDDLAFASDGDLLVLDGRTLRRLHDGAEIASMALPGLVPTASRLYVDGDAVYGQDPFGNLHAMASLASGLGAPTGPALVQNPHPVRRDRAKGTVTVDGQAFDVGGLDAGGRVLAGGDREWLVVDVVTEGSPIRVERGAIALDGDLERALPVDGREYAPARDVAVDADGRLVILDPQADGLHVARVTP